MGIADKVKGLIGSNGTDRAILTIVDSRNLKPKENTPAALTRGAMSLPGAALPKLPNLPIPSIPLQDIQEHKFFVQFNPSELNVSSVGGGMQPRQSLSDKAGGRPTFTYEPEPPRMEMSVNLIFDSVNNTDAFTNEKFVLNPTSLAAQGIKAIMKKKYTVQTEVEGLIAAIRDPYTRRIKFDWADFHFEGNLATLGARYTMFNPLGNPIRAVIQMSIVAVEEEDLFNAYKKAYKSIADNPIIGSTKNKSLAKKGQALGNLFNLPF